MNSLETKFFQNHSKVPKPQQSSLPWLAVDAIGLDFAQIANALRIELLVKIIGQNDLDCVKIHQTNLQM
jgi:hypothetical protein